ncbi:MAG: acyl-[acyl-carrier-protein] thioesterase [Tannerellaceae bacterium]|jgi:acyl-ACP thioesterase|nr:acyl-[acyl-carrier-protein] thioesterase [Tannerellaceae bacterium]
MNKVGRYKFKAESYLCDFRGKATAALLGTFALRAATLHADERGFGYEQVSKDNIAWVLSRLAMEIYDYPFHDRTLTIETWIESISNISTQRCFHFIDEKGKTSGYARTIWAAINTTTRRPVDILGWRPLLSDFIEGDKGFPLDKNIKIPAIKESQNPTSCYAIRYSDIDINKHVNSIKYMEHTINLFDISMFKSQRINKIEMAYIVESSFDDTLQLYKQEISQSEYLIEIKKDSTSICRSRIHWEAETIQE